MLDFKKSLFTICKGGAKNFIGSLNISSNSRNISSMGVQIFRNVWTGSPNISKYLDRGVHLRGVQIFRDRPFLRGDQKFRDMTIPVMHVR